MKQRIIIFDFDGTIADSLDTLVNISNRLAKQLGYKQTSQSELAQLKNLTSREIIKQSGISIFKVPFLLRKVKAEMSSEIKTLSLFPGMRETLIDLESMGHKLVIISSNSKSNILAFLEHNNLESIFYYVYSGTTVFGKDKVINKFIRQENINVADVIYVGDETRDIESAKKSKVVAIAVSWGFNTKEALAKENPDFLIEQPQELLSVVESLSNL
ncbi:HAD-IA family hydrolase [Aliterella atlantica]|uniref:Carotenoid oxygenase n=1 Tax=Aliterella atlantica CENA595 TaxID=1618023 RepID=A0A0D8ZX47_9CYAN|nr:HAD-IA family hydrolase [Aliterella atlantica]KJH73338.1 carotenoid oxygenase [Aliterella atlantica CENA595]